MKHFAAGWGEGLLSKGDNSELRDFQFPRKLVAN